MATEKDEERILKKNVIQEIADFEMGTKVSEFFPLKIFQKLSYGF